MATSGSPPVTDVQAAQISGSRFLFVDIAAQRAKQLRRGALPRLETRARRPERIAMEEMKQGLIRFDLPGVTPKGSAHGAHE